MKSKLLLCLALVLGCGLCGCEMAGRHSAIPQEAMTAGDWSETVNGLRGRLLFGKAETFNGTRLATVYLELQNVSDVLSPIGIGPNRSLPCAVLDAFNKPVPQSGMPADVWSPDPFWIMLPMDSTLRFRVSVTGYAVPKDAGLSIGLMSGNWIIPPATHGDYFLSASFVVAPGAVSVRTKTNIPPDEPWYGVLELPKVKIPAVHNSRPAAATNSPAKLSQADAIVEEMLDLNMQPGNPTFDDGRINPVEQRREEIIRRLRLTGDEAAPALIRALEDPDAQMRRNADLVIFELAWGYDSKPMDMRKTIPALIRATADEDGTVRAWAALDLGEMGPDAKTAVPVLIKLVRDPDEGCRNDACIALGDIGPAAKDALPALRNALNDPSRDTRQFAKRAIGLIQIVQ